MESAWRVRRSRTVFVSLWGDAWGRRRILAGIAVLSATGYFGLAVFTDASALVPLAFVGMLNGMGRDRGAASALDQAILPETVPDIRRTWALAWYNVTLDCGHALGALAAVIPTIVMSATGFNSQAAHQITFLFCAGAMLTCIVPYLALTPHIEVSTGSTASPARPVDPRSKRVITRLALLFGWTASAGAS